MVRLEVAGGRSWKENKEEIYGGSEGGRDVGWCERGGR